MRLECESCGHEAHAKTCPACQEAIMVWAKYCPLCGEAQKVTENTEEEAGGLENRRLCSDESCIGIIGSDGCCVVCGKRE